MYSYELNYKISEEIKPLNLISSINERNEPNN